MNEEIAYKLKSISIKLLLTIPAILVGIFAAIMFILKPLKDLWFPKDDSFELASQIALGMDTDTHLNL